MKKPLSFLGLFLFSTACSNPFSSQRSSVLQENPKPIHTNCNEVRFDQSELTIQQLRAMIHCLNQNQELEEIEAWSQAVTDQEFAPLILQFNSILKSEPELLYALKEVYTNMRNQGEFQDWIAQLFSKLQTHEQKRNLVHLIRKHSVWWRNFFEDPRFKINFQNITLLSKVESFKRITQEQLENENLGVTLQAIVRYHQQTDSLNFQELFQLFSKTSTSLFSDRKSVEKIAGFLNWIFEDGRIDVFSRAAESLATKTIHCFDQGKSVQTPLNTLLDELTKMDPPEITSFLEQKVPALILIGQGYCQIPTEVISAAKLLQQSASQDTLTTFFAFIRPLLSDPNFVLLVQSESFRKVVSALSQENKTHLFQDLLPLVNWLAKNPLLESHTAELLDSALDEFSGDELVFVIHSLPENETFFKILSKTILSLPKLKKNILSKKDWLAPFTKESFASVLDLISKMEQERKIIPILDRILVLFQKLMDQGKNSYHPISIPEAKHSNSTDSQNWLFPFWSNTRSVSQCSNFPLETNFFSIGNGFPEQYLNQLDQLSACYGTNQSFASLKDLASYLVQRDSSGLLLEKYSSLQERFMGFIFVSDANQAFRSLHKILHLNQNDLSQMQRLISASSTLLSTAKNALHAAPETRKLLARYTSKKESYDAFVKQKLFSGTSLIIRTDLRSQLETLTFKNLSNLFKEYCPSLDQNSRDCGIDADQVILYRKSPESLAAQITTEYLLSPQSWLHPLESKEWSRASTIPKTVSTMEYHLNPLLKQFEDNPSAIMSVFDFMKRNEQTDFKLLSFLKRGSQKFYLIPYLFQKANFPNTDHEFHSFIRLRIISDIDQLELLAINADFKAFSVMKNFGMSFIQEIATSWGDVPTSKRPKLGTSETLSEARSSILQQFSKFNSGILQRIGSCDPRGKNSWGQWFQNQFCNGEIRDLRARMFNLNWMISILDDDEVLTLLRDLFYSIYEHNSPHQRGIFSNGIKNVGACVSPSTNKDQCLEDLLEVIPKIARLGVLHQSGLAIANQNSVATSSILSLLSQANTEKKDLELSIFLSTKKGQAFIREILDLSMDLNPLEGTSVSTLLQNLSQLKNQQWLSFILNVYIKSPGLFAGFSSVIHSALQNIAVSALSPEMISLLSSLSSDLKNEHLVEEIAELLQSVRSSKKELQILFTSNLKEDLSLPWITLFSKAENQKQRDQISSFITGRGFDDFCDAYSDTKIAEKTYNFLEKSHQNSGVLDLLEECRRFLH